MSEVRIKAEPRTEFGKGAARRIRRADKVPGVLYGHGTEPRHVSLPGHELMLALKSPNVLLRLDGLDDAGPGELALPKAVQRNPVKGVLEHVDLLLVRSGEKVSVDVPIHVTGTVESGGLLEVSLDRLTVQAEATHIPIEFPVDIEGFPIGKHLTAADIELPAGVELDVDPESWVLHVAAAPTAEQLEAELTEAEAGIEREAGEAAQRPAQDGAAEGGAAGDRQPAGTGAEAG